MRSPSSSFTEPSARRPRVEWASHDVETDDGLLIEVKASGYLQAWDQHGPSDIRFSGPHARIWTPVRGYAPTASYNADVYLFAVETAREPALYDPLDTAQWEFYVVPRAALEKPAANSLRLNTVRKAAGPPVAFADLGKHIRAAAPINGPASETRPAGGRRRGARRLTGADAEVNGACGVAERVGATVSVGVAHRDQGVAGVPDA